MTASDLAASGGIERNAPETDAPMRGYPVTPKRDLQGALETWSGSPEWLFGFCYILLCYANPVLLFRGLLRKGDAMGAAVGLGVLLVAIAAGSRLSRKHTTGRPTKAALAFVAFSIFISVNYLVSGAKPTAVAQQIPSVILGYFVLSFIGSPGFGRYFCQVLATGMVANAGAAWFAPNFISSENPMLMLDGLADDSFGFFGGRRSGLLAIPGYAAFYALQGFAVCTGCFIEERRWYWALGSLASASLGLATGNRSFMIAGAAVCFLLPLLCGRSLGRSLVGVFVTALLLAVASYAWDSTDYGRLMSRRLDDSVLSAAIDERTFGDAGFVPSLKAVARAPLFGALRVAEPYGGLAVFNGEDWFSPHTGWAFLLTGHGVPVTLFLFAWHLGGFWGLARYRLREQALLGTRYASSWLVAFLGGQVVSLTDPMLDTLPMFYAVALGTHLMSRTRNVAAAVSSGHR